MAAVVSDGLAAHEMDRASRSATAARTASLAATLGLRFSVATDDSSARLRCWTKEGAESARAVAGGRNIPARSIGLCVVSKRGGSGLLQPKEKLGVDGDSVFPFPFLVVLARKKNYLRPV